MIMAQDQKQKYFFYDQSSANINVPAQQPPPPHRIYAVLIRLPHYDTCLMTERKKMQSLKLVSGSLISVNSLLV
ncbi:hypothetical protein Peur_011240 [Populus x canadensis]